MNRRNIIKSIVFFAAIAMLLVISYFYTGIRSPVNLLWYIAIMFAVYSAVVVISLLIAKLWKLQKASDKELKAEDEIFLQAVGFSQAALWIFLTLSPSNEIVDFVKWIIPLSAIICYGTRAYAKLKNSNKWRFYSTILLSIIIGISISTFADYILNTNLAGLVLIENVDVTKNLFITPLAFSPGLVAIFSMDTIRKRYGR